MTTKILAKPTGIALDEHISNLLGEVSQLVSVRPFVCQKYRELVGEDLEKEIKLSARWHDEGKKDKVWQDACQLDHQEFLRTKKSGNNLKKSGIRHEIVSLELMKNAKANVSLAVKVAVAAHHSKLSHKHRDRWLDRREFKEFWEEFVAKSNCFRASDKEALEKAIKLRYQFAGPRSLLQLVDHRASAIENNEVVPNLTPFSYKFPYEEKRGVQLLIEKLWDEPLAILRAPTGAGKTDAALLWAKHQIEQGRADRLIIAMPTRFTANALHINITENLANTGLYHSSAWYQRVKNQSNFQWDKKIFIDKEQDLARRLESSAVITTIDHLCIALTGVREEHHATFFNLAHSCLVIDEADFYDDFTQHNIVILLKVLKLLKVPVLVMSATIPESVKALYEQSGFTISQIYEEKKDYEKPKCFVKRYGKVETPNDIVEFLERGLKGEPMIIYANTVQSAQSFYRWFKNNNCKDLILYHSRFTEPDKATIENKLITMLGAKAWEEGQSKGVAILTQIGEISVNISADLIISELCPIDRLVQRVGRGARFTKRKDKKENVIAEVIIIDPYRINKKKNQQCLYPAPYGSYNYLVGWESAKALEKTNQLLVTGTYSAKSFIELVNEVYPTIEKELPHIKINKRALENCIITNWLILPVENVENEDDNTKDWYSRDIPPQKTIFANYKESVVWKEGIKTFRNMSQRREFEIRHGIKCHNYEFNDAVKKDLVEKVSFTIGEELTEDLFLVKKEYYNSEIGLNFDGAN